MGEELAKTPSLALALRVVLSWPIRIGRADWFRRLHRQRPAIAGEILLLIVIFCTLFAPFLAPYPPNTIEGSSLLVGPSWTHPLGTDELGRDILSRTLYGGRVSLEVAFIALAVGMGGGVAIGLVSGFKGGSVLDQAVMAVMDAWRSFPTLVLALGLVAVLGPDLKNIMIAVGITMMPTFARLTRGQVLSVRENDYVLAARALGAGANRIMWRHIFPNTLAPTLVYAVVVLSTAILVEASLSFLGLGVRPPTPTWGSMVRAGYGYLEVAPWYSLAPGMAIFITVIGTLLLGNGLRDALDPKGRGR